MSVTISNSPIHETAMITQVYGDTSTGSCGHHTGIDIVRYGGGNPSLYAIESGTVVQVNLTPTKALGNNVVFLGDSGYYWAYCHMMTGSVQVSVGDKVTTSTVIGTLDSTRKCKSDLTYI